MRLKKLTRSFLIRKKTLKNLSMLFLRMRVLHKTINMYRLKNMRYGTCSTIVPHVREHRNFDIKYIFEISRGK